MVIEISISLITGTKKNEYHLEVSQASDGTFSVEKIDANPEL